MWNLLLLLQLRSLIHVGLFHNTTIDSFSHSATTLLFELNKPKLLHPLDSLTSLGNLLIDYIVHLEWTKIPGLPRERDIAGNNSNTSSNHNDDSCDSFQSIRVPIDVINFDFVRLELLFHEYASHHNHELCDGLLHQHHLYRIFDTRLTHTRDDYKKEIQLRTHI